VSQRSMYLGEVEVVRGLKCDLAIKKTSHYLKNFEYILDRIARYIF
jgi:hypothetical protein